MIFNIPIPSPAKVGQASHLSNEVVEMEWTYRPPAKRKIIFIIILIVAVAAFFYFVKSGRGFQKILKEMLGPLIALLPALLFSLFVSKKYRLTNLGVYEGTKRLGLWTEFVAWQRVENQVRLKKKQALSNLAILYCNNTTETMRVTAIAGKYVRRQ
ncbi:MAG: hypothetical protein AB1393_12065 [Candidatus Edwardsbacteria bacterium]